jgi:hypothetical protein
MNKADVCRQLHNAAEFHLFGAGSWPADRESAGAFWKLLDDFGLTANVPDGAWHDPIHSSRLGAKRRTNEHFRRRRESLGHPTSPRSNGPFGR